MILCKCFIVSQDIKYLEHEQVHNGISTLNIFSFNAVKKGYSLK